MATPLIRALLKHIVSHMDELSARIQSLDNIVSDYVSKFEHAIELLDEIPGIGRRSAEVIIAEIGVDMSRFPSAAHLCSWAGLCPGNNESAGKRRSGRTTKGNSSLKSILVECAKSSIKKKDSYFHAQYHRIAPRRGFNRATVAVAHSMLIAIYHMLEENVPFHDLGADYYNTFNRDRKINSYLKKLENLGWQPPSSQMA